MEAQGCPELGGAELLESSCRRRSSASLELDGCQHTQRRVTTLAIAENFRMFEERARGFDARLPAFAIEQLDLNAAPKPFIRALS